MLADLADFAERKNVLRLELKSWFRRLLGGAGSSVGSLVAGCSFDVKCFMITLISGAGVVIFCCQKRFWFGLCGLTIERFRSTWESKEEDRGHRFGFWMNLDECVGPISKAFGQLLSHACFLVVFSLIFVSESGRLGFERKGFWIRGIAKTKFPQMFGFCWSQNWLFMLFDAFATGFDDLLVRWRQAWDFMFFDSCPEEAQGWAYGQLMVMWLLLGPVAVTSVGWSFTACKIQNQTCRNQGLRKLQDANCENLTNQGYNMISSNRGTRIKERGTVPKPGAPSTEGPPDLQWICFWFPRVLNGPELSDTIRGHFCLNLSAWSFLETLTNAVKLTLFCGIGYDVVSFFHFGFVH